MDEGRGTACQIVLEFLVTLNGSYGLVKKVPVCTYLQVWTKYDYDFDWRKMNILSYPKKIVFDQQLHEVYSHIVF